MLLGLAKAAVQRRVTMGLMCGVEPVGVCMSRRWGVSLPGAPGCVGRFCARVTRRCGARAGVSERLLFTALRWGVLLGSVLRGVRHSTRQASDMSGDVFALGL